MATITGRTLFCILLLSCGLSNSSTIPTEKLDTSTENITEASSTDTLSTIDTTVATEDTSTIVTFDVVNSTTVNNKCPGECYCSSYETSCIHMNLKEVPSGIDEHVTILMLTSNVIEKIEEDTFEKQNLYEIVSLQLNNNSINEIHPKAFSFLKHLEIIDLAYNNLTTIDPNLTINNTGLRIVRLDGNLNLVLPEEGPFLIAPKLIELNMSNCNIRYLPTDTFSAMPNLDTIDLRGNNITDLNTAALQNLSSLVKLNLPLSLKEIVSNICADLTFIKKLTFGRDDSEIVIDCMPYQQYLAFKSVINVNDEHDDTMFNGTNFLNTNLTINDTDYLAPNSSEENIEIPDEREDSMSTFGPSYDDTDANNSTETNFTIDLLPKSLDNNIVDENNTSTENSTIDVSLPHEKPGFMRKEVAPQPPSNSANDGQAKEKAENNTPKTATTSSSSGYSVENIILGTVITAIVFGVVFVIIKQRKSRRPDDTENQPEAQPLRNMGSSQK